MLLFKRNLSAVLRSASAAFKPLIPLSHRSTTTTTTKAKAPALPDSGPAHTQLVVDYLVSNIGFTPDRALRASKSLCQHRNFGRRADAVLDFLQTSGLSSSQIRTLIAWYPGLLRASVERVLLPRAAALRSHGFTGPVLVQLLRSNPFLLSLRQVLPRLLFWKSFFQADSDKFLRALKRNRSLVNHDIDGKIKPRLDLLRSYGLSDEDIGVVMTRANGLILRSPEGIRELMERTEALGFNPESRKFFQGLSVVAMLTNETLKKKIGFFQTFGWTEAESLEAFRRHPSVFSLSEEHIQAKMEFLVREAGLDVKCLVRYPLLLAFSLEKRLAPRHAVLCAVKSKGLCKDECELRTVMSFSDAEFVNRFILPYKMVVPDLHSNFLAACGGTNVST